MVHLLYSVGVFGIRLGLNSGSTLTLSEVGIRNALNYFSFLHTKHMRIVVKRIIRKVLSTWPDTHLMLGRNC